MKCIWVLHALGLLLSVVIFTRWTFNYLIYHTTYPGNNKYIYTFIFITSFINVYILFKYVSARNLPISRKKETNMFCFLNSFFFLYFSNFIITILVPCLILDLSYHYF